MKTSLNFIICIPVFFMHTIVLPFEAVAVAAPALASVSPILEQVYKKCMTQKNTPKSVSKELQQAIEQLGVHHQLQEKPDVVATQQEHYSPGVSKNIIHIPAHTLHEIEDALAGKGSSHNKKLQEGIIHHELAHIKLNSQQKKNRFTALVCMLALGCVAALSVQNSERSTCANLFLAAFMYIFTHLSIKAFDRHDELCADDGIPADKILLQAQADDFHDQHTKFAQCITREQTIERGSCFQRLLINSGFAKQFHKKSWLYPLLYIDQEHPDPKTRADRFHARLQQLKDA